LVIEIEIEQLFKIGNTREEGTNKKFEGETESYGEIIGRN
jgi:hypothetical protein